MPQRFQEEGYYVTAAGKLFHNGGQQNENYMPNYGGQFGGFGPLPEKKISDYPGHPLWDWGAYPDSDEEMPDFKVADWAIAELSNNHDSSLWMGVTCARWIVGIYKSRQFARLTVSGTSEI